MPLVVDFTKVKISPIDLNRRVYEKYNRSVSKIFWNNLGFEIIFSCQENLAFQKASLQHNSRRSQIGVKFVSDEVNHANLNLESRRLI